MTGLSEFVPADLVKAWPTMDEQEQESLLHEAGVVAVACTKGEDGQYGRTELVQALIVLELEEQRRVALEVDA